MMIYYAVSRDTKYILDEVPVCVSYDSDYGLAESPLINCASEVTNNIVDERGKTPEKWAEFFDSGILIHLHCQKSSTMNPR